MMSSLKNWTCAIQSNSITSILQQPVSHFADLPGRGGGDSPCHSGLMIYYHPLLVTGNWNSADLLLNCGRGSFLLKTEADYLNEMAADLEMYSMQYVITTHSAQTAAICHKLLLLLATLHSNMWPNLDEQPLSKYSGMVSFLIKLFYGLQSTEPEEQAETSLCKWYSSQSFITSSA